MPSSEGNWTAGTDGILLKMTHYDFTISHEDFTYATEDHYSNPTYMPSPYGAWLAMSDNPLSDGFSGWFHYKDGTNIAIDNALVLSYDAANDVHR